MIKPRIPVAAPVLGAEELKNVISAVKSNAISGVFGDYISQFEEEFSAFVGCNYGISVTNGTAAIHLALRALGIKPGDEVLVAAYTNMATFFPVLYLGATPIPIDVELDTGNIDPALVEAAVTERTKAIIVVHVFGHPADMDPILEIAKRNEIAVVEDCAEAHGATYKGRPVGSLGDVACYSFYANKIITTGEGGMVTTNNEEIADKAKLLRSFAYGRKERFMHEDVGFNYRMSNLHAAIGCGQMKSAISTIEKKRQLARSYSDGLKGLVGLRLPVEKGYAKNVYWMYHVILTEHVRSTRSEIMGRLSELGVETRPGFVPYNQQRIFLEKRLVTAGQCPVANHLSKHAFYLPSGTDLNAEEVKYVVGAVSEVISDAQR